MLVVRKSRIPNAGRGLFTTSPIRKNDIIVEYLGDKLTWKQVLKRYKENLDEVRYVFCITDDNCIDAKPRKDELAQYANDGNGGGKTSPFKNNCEYRIIKKRPYIVATKNIPANSELLVDYGDEYWEALQENVDMMDKKRKKKMNQPEVRIPLGGEKAASTKKSAKKKNGGKEKSGRKKGGSGSTKKGGRKKGGSGSKKSKKK